MEVCTARADRERSEPDDNEAEDEGPETTQRAPVRDAVEHVANGRRCELCAEDDDLADVALAEIEGEDRLHARGDQPRYYAGEAQQDANAGSLPPK